MTEKTITHGASFSTTLYNPSITPPPENHAVLAVWPEAGDEDFGLYDAGSQKWEASAWKEDGKWCHLEGVDTANTHPPSFWAFLPGDPLSATFLSTNQ